MIRILLFSSLVLFSFVANGSHPPLIIKRLLDDIYIYTTFNTYKGNQYAANGMYIVTSQGVIMIDSPWDTSQFQPLLDSIERRHQQPVVMCLATHYHEDRTAGLGYFRAQGIKTYTTALTDSLSRTEGYELAEHLIYNDTTFRVGDLSFSTYFPGHGHAPDNIVVWIEASKVLFGGCFIKGVAANHLGYTGVADIPAWKRSIQKVKSKFPDPNWVIPGHDDWDRGACINHTYQLLLDKIQASLVSDQK